MMAGVRGICSTIAVSLSYTVRVRRNFTESEAVYFQR